MGWLCMQRVEAEGTWSLFCPNEAPGLADVWGPEFEVSRTATLLHVHCRCASRAHVLQCCGGIPIASPDDTACTCLRLWPTIHVAVVQALYTKYEAEGRARRVLPARQLWFSILEAQVSYFPVSPSEPVPRAIWSTNKRIGGQSNDMCHCGVQVETGNPYMLYKDSCNRKSNQQNLGTIRCSNLCTEILEYTSPEETAVRPRCSMSDCHGSFADCHESQQPADRGCKRCRSASPSD